MRTFGFGQKSGQVMQMAYTTKNIHAAMDWWMKNANVGPWFLLDSFTGPEQRYRGEPTQADVMLAMSFAGHMNIELIQPKDERPSVYRETIRVRGYGFHHMAIAVEDVEAARRKYHQLGYHEAFSTPVPSGGSVYFMGDGPEAPGFIELIPATDATDEMFTRYWKASVDWDGRDPIRKFG
ncbi:MAG TPA: VOC family protein [Steroidobacteraceae bacterium]|nr:VOC family protein [Steroidobacteraceae bacterium]